MVWPVGMRHSASSQSKERTHSHSADFNFCWKKKYHKPSRTKKAMQLGVCGSASRVLPAACNPSSHCRSSYCCLLTAPALQPVATYSTVLCMAWSEASVTALEVPGPLLSCPSMRCTDYFWLSVTPNLQIASMLLAVLMNM